MTRRSAHTGTSRTAARSTDDFPIVTGSAAPLSYITGTHNVKVGMQDTWGSYRRTDTSNADLRAMFLNGVATRRNDPELVGRAF